MNSHVLPVLISDATTCPLLLIMCCFGTKAN
jgi:hypothetical protein